VLYLAFELSQKQWKLGFTTGLGVPPRISTIAARDLAALTAAIQKAKRRFSLPAEVPVLSCYEAGREGFWLHRALLSQAIGNLIVDAASIEVNRRARRTKTDRLDVSKLLTMLVRFHLGERQVWRIVSVPNEAQEDLRHLHRELKTLKTERTRHINRIKGLLVSHGVVLAVRRDFPDHLAQVRRWNGTPIPPYLQARLLREYERIQLVNAQIKALEDRRQAMLADSSLASLEQVRKLLQLRGIGIQSAWLFVMEFYSWRNFRNGREIGALAGLTDSHYQSGSRRREQGISKAGNRFVRGIAIETAWSWLRYQPESQLSQWYQTRFAKGGKRQRKIGIVALARRLLISLWQYLETDCLPEGAVLKGI
jgi:transposase